MWFYLSRFQLVTNDLEIIPTQQSLLELRRAVAFCEQVESSINAGEGVTAFAARTFSRKWLFRAAKGVVCPPERQRHLNS